MQIMDDIIIALAILLIGLAALDWFELHAYNFEAILAITTALIQAHFRTKDK